MTIEFGNWRLVPVDQLNFELCHRHVTSRGKNAGTERWHRLGRFYSFSTIGNALWFAATRELAEEDGAAVAEIREALSEFERIANNLLRDAQGCAQQLQGTHSSPQASIDD